MSNKIVKYYLSDITLTMSHYPYSVSSVASHISSWFFTRLFRDRVRLIKCSITFSTVGEGLNCFKGITERKRERMLAIESVGKTGTNKAFNKIGSRSYVDAH